MTIRRFLGKAIVLAAIYAFALQTVLGAAILAGYAVSGSTLAPAVLCSDARPDGSGGPAGNGEGNFFCGHCVLPGCGTQQTVSPLAGVQMPLPPAVAAGLLSFAGETARAVPPVAGPRLARAPPQA